MADVLSITICGEGSSDQALKHVIEWLAKQHANRQVIASHNASRGNLREKIQRAAEEDPCDILCIHRDGNNKGIDSRRQEIESAYDAAKDSQGDLPPHVCLIPMRETEAWLLIDGEAIRQAAGKGRSINPPPVSAIESTIQPKEKLHELLREASGHSSASRRKRKFRPEERVHRVAELIDDFSPLRELPAFQAFEREFASVIAAVLAKPAPRR